MPRPGRTLTPSIIPKRGHTPLQHFVRPSNYPPTDQWIVGLNHCSLVTSNVKFFFYFPPLLLLETTLSTQHRKEAMQTRTNKLRLICMAEAGCAGLHHIGALAFFHVNSFNLFNTFNFACGSDRITDYRSLITNLPHRSPTGSSSIQSPAKSTQVQLSPPKNLFPPLLM